MRWSTTNIYVQPYTVYYMGVTHLHSWCILYGTNCSLHWTYGQCSTGHIFFLAVHIPDLVIIPRPHCSIRCLETIYSDTNTQGVGVTVNVFNVIRQDVCHRYAISQRMHYMGPDRPQRSSPRLAGRRPPLPKYGVCPRCLHRRRRRLLKRLAQLHAIRLELYRLRLTSSWTLQIPCKHERSQL